jgi:hypothetical protein
MVLEDEIYLLLKSMTLDRSIDKDIKKDRLKSLAKILNIKWVESNPSEFIKRLDGKKLSYPQSKEMIEWFGERVYDLKKDGKYSKIVSGYIESINSKGETIYEYKSFVVDCRILGTYFDANLNNIVFSTHESYNRVTFTEFEIIDEVADAKKGLE